MAAPFTPSPNTKINSGSSIIFATAPIVTENIPVVEYPCAFINGFMPVDTMAGRVPSK